MAKKDNKDKFIETAQKFIQKQQFDKAIKEYEKAFDSDKKDARIALKLGELYVKIKKPQDGLKYFRQAGISYAKDGFYPKAVAVYKQILGIDDSSLEVRLEIADLYFKLGLMSDAISNYRTVLEKYEKDENKDKVLEIIRKMVEIEPQNINSRIKLAEFYFKSGQREQGYTEFRRAAEELKKAQRWEDLVKLNEKLTKADPTNPDNFYGYGDALLERGELEKSFQAFAQVLKYRPDDNDAMEKLVTVSIRLKDTQNAVFYLKKLAVAAENRGDKASAQKYYDRVRKIHPGDDDAKAKLGTGTAPSQKAPSPPSPKTAPARQPPPTAKAAPSHPPPPKPTFDLEGEDDEKIEALSEADDETAMQPPPEPVADAMVESALIQPTEEELKPPSADQVPGMITEADVYLKYGLIDKAQQYITRILSSFPEYHEAVRLGALVDKENGKLKEAVQGLLKAAQMARKKNAANDARNYAEEALGLDPANSQAQALMAELDSGVEISIGVEDEKPAPVRASATDPTLDEDILTIEGESPEEQISLAGDSAPAAEPTLEIADEEPFGFVEERGDEQLLLADDEPAPAPRKAAPPPRAAEPTLELEGEDQTLIAEPEAPAIEFEEEAPLELGPTPQARAAEEAPLELGPTPQARAAEEAPLLEVEEEEIEAIAEKKPAPIKPAAPPAAKAPTPRPVQKAATPPPQKAAEAPQPKAAPAPKTTPAPPKKVVLARIELDMEEADFYISQGLAQEARKVYEKILKTAPDYAPAIAKLKEFDKIAATAKPSAPIFEEIEEIEVEELELEEVPSVASAVEAAEDAIGMTFREEGEEMPSEVMEELALETQPPEPPPEPEPLEEAGPEPEPLKAAAPEMIEEEEIAEVNLEEEEIPSEALDEIALETQPPEPPSEPEALEAAEPELEIQAETFKEELLESPAPREVLSPKDAETDTIEEPVKPSARSLDLDDEWEEEAPVEESREETPLPISKPVGMDGIADAADEAWGAALEPEQDETQKQPTAAEVHPEIDGVAEAADEAFGATFREESEAGKESFDLSSVLGEKEAEGIAKSASQEAETGGADDIGSIIQTFREHVHSQIGQDAGAHFDLGIAYKEMGLLDEAINSFSTALKAGANASQCLNMIGLCFIDQGELSKAESVFREGLTEKTLSEREMITLKYELGMVLEELGRLNDALEVFREVAKVNERFREVDLAIIRLEERIGVRAAPSQKKISYI